MDSPLGFVIEEVNKNLAGLTERYCYRAKLQNSCVAASQCRYKIAASLRASAHAGVAAPRLNVQPDRLRGKPSPAGEGAERSEAGVEGTP